jgi:hypothetical protein
VTEPYNPLHKLNLGKSVAEALLDTEADSLGSLKAFEGAGIYVLYYRGPFAAYARMAKRNADSPQWPIYIGKAVPAGARRGASLLSEPKGNYLFNRLKEHADSIEQVGNLKLKDFTCRYLRVDDIWIPLGETLLISRFRPLWNLVVDGFGNHDPGAGRYNGEIPLWDLLHPGRSWAPKMQPRKRGETPADIEKLVKTFLSENEPPDDPHISFSPVGTKP